MLTLIFVALLGSTFMFIAMSYLVFQHESRPQFDAVRCRHVALSRISARKTGRRIEKVLCSKYRTFVEAVSAFSATFEPGCRPAAVAFSFFSSFF
ncbi:hypothetical protein ACQKWADRAFT_294928 [Trichoderma austrokoningii]